jgi:hypothetical protein
MAAGVVMPAFAQDNFPDVPANHWAYEALARMKKDGLLVGYPDGLFRGPRPASRYELAVAMHAVYTNLQAKIDGLQDQLKALSGVTPQDIQNLKDAIANLQSQIDAMKGWGDDIAALKRATEQFDRELRNLGVDVEAMKKDLGDLAGRVKALEDRKPTVNISGDLNFLMLAGNSAGNRPGLDVDGRFEGNDGGAPVGLTRDVTFLHELGVTFSSTNDKGPTWHGTVVIGNTLGQEGLGSQSTLSSGVPLSYGYGEANEDVYIQDLSVDFKGGVIGLNYDAQVGRVGYKLSPYMFQRIEPSSYFSNDRWDNGEYYFDGAIVGFNFGGAKVHVWGGKNSQMYTVDGIDLDPTIVGNNRVAGGFAESPTANPAFASIDRTLAADASIPLGKIGDVKVGYLWLENNENDLFDTGTSATGQGGGANRDEVFGGDANLHFGRIKVEGGFHESDLMDQASNVNNSDNTAWNAKASYSDEHHYAIWGGYRVIESNYFAPGDWGRLGIIRDPANIKGWQVGGHLHLAKGLMLTGTAEFDKGNKTEDDTTTLTSSPFDSDTNITSYIGRLDYKVNPNFSIYGSYENDRFSSLDPSVAPLNGGASSYAWTTFGIGYGLSANTKLSLQYQLSNIGNDFILGQGNLTNAPADGRFTGGLLTGQITVKF